MTRGIIKLAIEEAKNSSYHWRIGAVIFKGQRIFGSGHNRIVRTFFIPDKYKKYPVSLHAEQDAAIGLDWEKLKGCSILTIKLTRSGMMSMAKPCELCQKLLRHIGIKKMYYSDDLGNIIVEKINPRG